MRGKQETSYYSKPIERIHRDFKGICALCGNYVEIEDASRDHIIPRSKGGGNGRDNIQLTHKTCNNNKGDDLYPINWREKLKEAITVPKGYVCSRCNLPVQKWQKDRNYLKRVIRRGNIIVVHEWCHDDMVKYGKF